MTELIHKLMPWAIGLIWVVVVEPRLKRIVLAHVQRPRPELPKALRVGSAILCVTGAVFLIAGVITGALFSDLGLLWQTFWISVSAVGGFVWVKTTIALRDGKPSVRWTTIPFALAMFITLPVVGWILAPVSLYCIYGNRGSREYYRGAQQAECTVPVKAAPSASSSVR